MSAEGLRRHLVWLLRSRHAHVDFERAVAGWPPQLAGARAEGHPHTAWQLLEHLRIAQWDILEFSRNEAHQSPDWPSGYWPSDPFPPSTEAWQASLSAFRADLDALCSLIEDPATDLLAELPWSDGATVLREVLLVADHNAYHLGQLVSLRRALGVWPGE